MYPEQHLRTQARGRKLSLLCSRRMALRSKPRPLAKGACVLLLCPPSRSGLNHTFAPRVNHLTLRKQPPLSPASSLRLHARPYATAAFIVPVAPTQRHHARCSTRLAIKYQTLNLALYYAFSSFQTSYLFSLRDRTTSIPILAFRRTLPSRPRSRHRYSVYLSGNSRKGLKASAWLILDDDSVLNLTESIGSPAFRPQARCAASTRPLRCSMLGRNVRDRDCDVILW